MKTIKGHTNTTLPVALKNVYIDTAVEKKENVKSRANKNTYLESLLKLIGNDGADITGIANIRSSVVFSYGKHCQKETEAMFDRHSMSVFVESAQSQDCLTIFNSLIAIRNNVNHQDASPELTHQTIMDHKDIVMVVLSVLLRRM